MKMASIFAWVVTDSVAVATMCANANIRAAALKEMVHVSTHPATNVPEPVAVSFHADVAATATVHASAQHVGMRKDLVSAAKHVVLIPASARRR